MKLFHHAVTAFSGVTLTIGYLKGLPWTKQENWSGTHKREKVRKITPHSEEEVIRILSEVRNHNLLISSSSSTSTNEDEKIRIRPVGSGLSPNGLGLCNENGYVMDLGCYMDSILEINKEEKTVRVQSGATVGKVLDALKEHGLTLPNLASINEQQIGGFTQVSAHGTGARLPPVDEFVTEMKLASPSLGMLRLNSQSFPEVFKFAKVGMGCLGVVTEVTLQCVDAHYLSEQVKVLTRKEIRKHHESIIQSNQHAKMLWIPYTDKVVVITANQNPAAVVVADDDNTNNNDPLKSMKDLFIKISGKDNITRKDSLLSFADMRDKLLQYNPLDVEHVKLVNQAEAEYWSSIAMNKPETRGKSEEIIGFPCGGKQWVWEICLENGTIDNVLDRDLELMEVILDLIETNNIPAPAPIEHRWTSRSTSYMSPAYSNEKNALFSWIGIIMYLPQDQGKEKVSEAFKHYQKLIENHPKFKQFKAKVHLAKAEEPYHDNDDKEKQQLLQQFHGIRLVLDDQKILSNDWTDKLF